MLRGCSPCFPLPKPPTRHLLFKGPHALLSVPTHAPTPLQVPSFLYAMPLGGNRVFLEETCLVARPPMPFATLKRRLERRCKALGIKVGCWAATDVCLWPCKLMRKPARLSSPACPAACCGMMQHATSLPHTACLTRGMQSADWRAARGGVELHPCWRPAAAARPAGGGLWCGGQPGAPRCVGGV